MHKLQNSIETSLGVFQVTSESKRLYFFKSPRTYIIPVDVRFARLHTAWNRWREQAFALYWRANGPLKSNTEDALILAPTDGKSKDEWRAAGASDILEVLHRVVVLILGQPNGIETLLAIRLANSSIKGVLRSNRAMRPYVSDEFSLSESIELREALTTSLPAIDRQHFRLLAQYLRMIE